MLVEIIISRSNRPNIDVYKLTTNCISFKFLQVGKEDILLIKEEITHTKEMSNIHHYTRFKTNYL